MTEVRFSFTLEELGAALTHVGLLTDDDKFIPKEVLEQHLPSLLHYLIQIREAK